MKEDLHARVDGLLEDETFFEGFEEALMTSL